MARSKKSKTVRRGRGPRSSSPSLVATQGWPSNNQNGGGHVNGAARNGFNQDGPHLTMSQEARNTERHTAWRNNAQLRHTGIKFVSAGDMVLDDPETLNDPDSNNTLPETGDDPADSKKEERQSPPDCSPEEKTEQDARDDEDGNAPMVADEDMSDMFFIDRKGEDPPAHLRFENPTIPVIPDSPRSSSSEDEIVFKGRGRRPQYSFDHSTQQNSHIQPTLPPPDDLVISPTASGTFTTEPEPSIFHTSRPAFHSKTKPDDFISLSGKPNRSRPRKNLKPIGPKWDSEDSDDSEILADYIANMMDDDTSDEDSEAAMEETSAPRRGVRPRTVSWSSADLEDLNDLSSSDELPGEVSRVFSMRERNESVQYLLIGMGQSADEARWIRKEHLTMPGAEESIRLFEENALLLAADQVVDSDGDSTDNDPSENEDEEDDDEVEPSPLSGEEPQELTDEQMARILQTQDSFGLGTGDVLLFDGNTDGFAYKSKSFVKASKSKRAQRREGHFPSASAFADALDQDPYGAFDIMDFERPSLRKKPKGRRPTQEFDLSDSDLAWELEQSWENDRKNKKAKKLEREELRAQGLLGTKPGKINMKAKYPEGMSFDDVKEEIRTFLASSTGRELNHWVNTESSLSLPPMDKRNRKLVHELANLLSLKSISRGNGTSRFPILTKTSRTPNFEGQSINHVDRLFSSGRFMRRMDKHQRGSGVKPIAKGRGNVKAASYMDGDIVGASAPEIGVENRGRAMLEKMGWSSGTALGALNNKGILQPVVHVVKRSKAGLG
ncbi:hypothetical protein FQN51_008551 [Onygenales sp. PD_10]|nr:hypothetical protein FQN51_008551 [Onygenales sp. PD_10]